MRTICKSFHESQQKRRARSPRKANKPKTTSSSQLRQLRRRLQPLQQRKMLLKLIYRMSQSQEGIDIVTTTITIAIIRKTALMSRVKV